MRNAQEGVQTPRRHEASYLEKNSRHKTGSVYTISGRRFGHARVGGAWSLEHTLVPCINIF